jgi:probable phosphoglycerate mutase
VTELLLIRHGQASHNLENRWEGWGATPLTSMGRRQAQAIARRLASSPDAIMHLYTSPLLRARQTAMPIGVQLGLKPINHQGLREIDFGRVSGLTTDSFRESMPGVFTRWQNRSDLTFQFPGGEQRLAFYRRVGQALDGIAARHPGARVALVAHGGTIRAGLAHLLPDIMADWWSYRLDNASLTHVTVGPDGNSLNTLNDNQHLDGRWNHAEEESKGEQS